jgi:hypothetical protein
MGVSWSGSCRSRNEDCSMDGWRVKVDPGPVIDGGQDAGWAAVPGVDLAADERLRPVLFIIDVDGERFAVRQVADGGWSYDWLSGPNHGYGFSTSGPPISSNEDHREAIRTFLNMIDPATGYIADD